MTIVSEIMIHNPYAVADDQNALEVLTQMIERGVMSAVVMEGQRVSGIVTSTDYIDAIGDHAGGSWLKSVPVSAIMARNLVAVSPHSPVNEVATIMRRHRIRHVIVVEVFDAVGIISHAEILKWWCNQQVAEA